MRKHILAASLLLVLSACSETNRDKIGEAQLCLDTATPSTVNSCLSKISGIESANAYALRCSANFIAQGLGSASTLSEALNNLSGMGGNAALFSVLRFKASTTTEAASLASSAQANCDKSGNAGMKLIASMATTATTLSNLVSGVGPIDPNNPPSETDIKNALNSLASQLNSGDQTQVDSATAQVQAITDALVSTYNSSCTSGSSQQTDICKQLQPAFATLPPGASNSDIAKALITELNKN